MKDCARKAVKYAESRGYTFERINSKGFRYYRNANGHEIGINTGMDDRAYKIVCTLIDRACGVGPDLSQKRKPEQIKAEQERQRQILRAERVRLAAELDEILRQRHRDALSGLGSELTLRDIKALERRIEDNDRKQRELSRQMASVPVGAA